MTTVNAHAVNDLNNDVLCEIVKHLSLSEMLRFALSCKRINKCIQLPLRAALSAYVLEVKKKYTLSVLYQLLGTTCHLYYDYDLLKSTHVYTVKRRELYDKQWYWIYCYVRILNPIG